MLRSINENLILLNFNKKLKQKPKKKKVQDDPIHETESNDLTIAVLQHSHSRHSYIQQASIRVGTGKA